MSGVPAMHHIVRHRVDDCTIVVIVSGGKGDRKKTAYGAPRAARCSQRCRTLGRLHSIWIKGEFAASCTTGFAVSHGRLPHAISVVGKEKWE